MGHREPRSIVQTDSLDVETRTELWNILHQLKTNLERARRGGAKTESQLLSALWQWQFKEPLDEKPSDLAIWLRVKSTILTGNWYDALDLLEEVLGYLRRYRDAYHPATSPDPLAGALNERFEHFMVGYRVIGDTITPIDSATGVEAVIAATNDTTPIAGARHSLERATDLLADRESPDYANSIKESISAVEAVVKKVTGEGTLGAGLNRLEAAGLTIHPALKGALSKMYGWTSDADGIRHAGIEAADADQALAKYVLVTCSAFVSYLIEEGRKTGLLK